MTEDNKIKIGISIGDLNGIGIELILKTFADARMFEFCTPIVFASTNVMSHYKKILNINIQVQGVDSVEKAIDGKLNTFNVWKENVEVLPGKENQSGGAYALKSLSSAVEALKDGSIDALLTCPINKDNIQSENFKFPGHTEYLESKINGKSLMILMSDEIKVGLITGHIPVSEISNTITPELIKVKVELMYNALIQDFKISKPKIAVLGLNPHCGDKGLIGKEDDEIIKPTILEIKESGKLVFGPYAADGFFGAKTYKQFDGVLAMYHDQGLAPFKSLSFGKGVNYTAGLEKVRTSPDHGTAFEISGKGVADESSFKEALFQAIEIFKNRQDSLFLNKNSLKKSRR